VVAAEGVRDRGVLGLPERLAGDRLGDRVDVGLEPSELMLVAAHPSDLAGARRAGLRTALVDRPLEYGPGSPARADPSADESVGDLHELAERLAG
jgi:FMN phosphatase YigB (HAD superfamily)